MGTQSVFTLPGTERVWRMGPDRTAALKLENSQTGQCVMAFEEKAPAGVETPFHLHRDSDEVLYVLSGQYRFKVGNQVGEGGPGACAFMPRGVGHAWKCVGPDAGRAFFFYTPGGAGRVFEEATNLEIQAPTSTDVAPELEELLNRFGWEILGPPPF